jgi:hypothetical protein
MAVTVALTIDTFTLRDKREERRERRVLWGLIGVVPPLMSY